MIFLIIPILVLFDEHYISQFNLIYMSSIKSALTTKCASYQSVQNALLKSCDIYHIGFAYPTFSNTVLFYFSRFPRSMSFVFESTNLFLSFAFQVLSHHINTFINTIIIITYDDQHYLAHLSYRHSPQQIVRDGGYFSKHSYE